MWSYNVSGRKSKSFLASEGRKEGDIPSITLNDLMSK